MCRSLHQGCWHLAAGLQILKVNTWSLSFKKPFLLFEKPDNCYKIKNSLYEPTEIPFQKCSCGAVGRWTSRLHYTIDVSPLVLWEYYKYCFSDRLSAQKLEAETSIWSSVYMKTYWNSQTVYSHLLLYAAFYFVEHIS